MINPAAVPPNRLPVFLLHLNVMLNILYYPTLPVRPMMMDQPTKLTKEKEIGPKCPVDLGFEEIGFPLYSDGCGSFAVKSEDRCCVPLCPWPRYYSMNMGVNEQPCPRRTESFTHEMVNDNICCRVHHPWPAEQYIKMGYALNEDGTCDYPKMKVGEGCCCPRCPERTNEYHLPGRREKGTCHIGELVPNPVGGEGAMMCRCPADEE